ncbi:unnamed protein product [Alopecurus aequalis]
MPPQLPPAPATGEARAEEGEILLRLPPDDPGCLFRASLVCKFWRDHVTSPKFARSYRDFHRTPPLLGFFENHATVPVWIEPSTPTFPSPLMYPDHRELFVLDCRHGLVLLRTPVSDSDEPAERLIVWDPVGRRQWEFPPPEFANTVIYDNAVVLCAADGCDHLDCHGGRFLVAYVGTNYSVAHASVFSSQTRAWSPVASCYPPEHNLEISKDELKALVGNLLYFHCEPCSIVLRYDHINLELAMIDGSGILSDRYVLMKTEEGGLGCASLQESCICLWSMETAPDGSVAWTQGRVIKLEMLLSSNSSNVIGFTDGIGILYLRTASGIFTVDLNSGGIKKILSIRSFSATPYMSFYTPDQARAITLPSTMASSPKNVVVAQDEGGGWEEVGDGEKEGEQQEEEAARELFSEGSKAFQDLDFVSAVDCLGHSLRIRVAHHGKLSPKCRDTYYRYGWALLRKAQAQNAPNAHPLTDLDLAWKMLHVARVILEKSLTLEKSPGSTREIPGSTREKVKILAALAKVSMRREDTDYSFIACYKALAILAYFVDPYYRQIMNLSVQTCLTFEFPESGDAKAISSWKSRIQKLKRGNEALLADIGDEASATEAGLAKDILFVTNILLSALEEKLESPEQAISTRVSEASGELYESLTSSSQFSGSSNTVSTAETSGTAGSTGTDLETAGRGIKRANVEQTYAEPRPKKFAEESPSAESDGSNSTDGQSGSMA